MKKIVEIAPIVIALAALYVAAQQGKIQREHNRTSVEPRLSSYFSNDGATDQWGLFMINNGLGPAFIENMDIFIDGARIENSEFGKFFEAAKALNLQVLCFKFARAPRNHSIKVGEEYFWVKTQPKAPKNCSGSKLKLMAAVTSERINYKLKFKSIYGAKFEHTLSSNNQKKLSE